MKITDFLGVILYGLVSGYRCCGGICCFHPALNISTRKCVWVNSSYFCHWWDCWVVCLDTTYATEWSAMGPSTCRSVVCHGPNTFSWMACHGTTTLETEWSVMFSKLATKPSLSQHWLIFTSFQNTSQWVTHTGNRPVCYVWHCVSEQASVIKKFSHLAWLPIHSLLNSVFSLNYLQYRNVSCIFVNCDINFLWFPELHITDNHLFSVITNV